MSTKKRAAPRAKSKGASEEELTAKYGEAAVNSGLRQQPTSFRRRLAQRDSLDQHFTRLWLDFAIKGVGERKVLDDRTRYLVLIGQFTMTKSHGPLEDAVRAAIAAGVPAREALEIILQCVIYGGHAAVEPAIQVFHAVAEELGLMEELKSTQLPLDGRDAGRSYEEESARWHPDDKADPRFAPLMERHGWLAVGRGLALRPRHHLNTLGWQDALDPNWAGLWVKFVYQGMYSRGIVDDRTRLLCMVGNCAAVGEAVQGRAHMKGALRAGARPREVLEVILQTSVNFGMPAMLHSLKIFVELMRSEGRIAEIGNPPEREETS